MKHILFYLLFIGLTVSSNNLYAQHWLWAKDTTGNSEAGGQQCVVLDKYGYIYCKTDYLIKHAPNGRIVWQKPIPGWYSSSPMTADNAGYLYRQYQTNGGDTIYVEKIDTAGNEIWTRKLIPQGPIAPYSYITDFFINVDNLGHLYVSGQFTSPVIYGGNDSLVNCLAYIPMVNGAPKPFIVKYDTAGNQLWMKSTGCSDSTIANGITTDHSGNIFLTGVTTGSIDFNGSRVSIPYNGCAYYVAKCDSNLNLIWIKMNHHSPHVNLGWINISDYPSEIRTDNAGNAYVGGDYYGSDTLSGTTLLPMPSYTFGGFVAKYNGTNGNLLWVKTNTNCINYTSGMATNGSGITYFTYPSLSTSTFGGVNMPVNQPTTAGYNEVIVGLDSAGNVLCGELMGGSIGDDECGLAIDNAGNAYMLGDYIHSAKFGKITLNPGNDTERYFLAKFTCFASQTGVQEEEVRSQPEIYPNPATNELFIKLNGNKTTNASISNLLGQLLIQANLTNQQPAIQISQLPPGMYLLKLSVGEDSQVMRFIKD